MDRNSKFLSIMTEFQKRKKNRIRISKKNRQHNGPKIQ